MNLIYRLNKIFGTICVEIEGFFTERFLNICKFNRIRVWDIQNIVDGKMRFKVCIKDFKKLKSISKKTKCKIKIKNKEGIYFIFFKYRKRKMFLILLLFLILLFIFSNQFIWNIEIKGNDKYINEDIINSLKTLNIKKGTFKKDIDLNLLAKNLRSMLKDASFISVNISGTTLNLNIKEKTLIDENNNNIGDIYSSKDGIIKKVVVENGTPKYKLGSYIKENMLLIEGKIYSEYLDTKDVKAKGKVYVQRQYNFEKEYKFYNLIKKMSSKIRYNIGFSINFKEFYINYLNKDKKYDKIKYSKSINFLGNNVSFDLYKFIEYSEEEKKLSLNEIKDIFNKEALSYITDIKNKSKELEIINEKINIEENKDNVKMKKIFIVQEEIGKFKERDNNG